MIAKEAFPFLTPQNHHTTSPRSIDYNCIAWAMSDSEHWWQPGTFWPIPVQTTDFTVAALVRAFEHVGYAGCGMDASLQPGAEKVALFSTTLYYTHAARQLPSGKWTSKLGKAEDIEHDTPQDVAGGA